METSYFITEKRSTETQDNLDQSLDNCYFNTLTSKLLSQVEKQESYETTNFFSAHQNYLNYDSIAITPDISESIANIHNSEFDQSKEPSEDFLNLIFNQEASLNLNLQEDPHSASSPASSPSIGPITPKKKRSKNSLPKKSLKRQKETNITSLSTKPPVTTTCLPNNNRTKINPSGTLNSVITGNTTDRKVPFLNVSKCHPKCFNCPHRSLVARTSPFVKVTPLTSLTSPNPNISPLPFTNNNTTKTVNSQSITPVTTSSITVNPLSNTSTTLAPPLPVTSSLVKKNPIQKKCSQVNKNTSANNISKVNSSSTQLNITSKSLNQVASLTTPPPPPPTTTTTTSSSSSTPPPPTTTTTTPTTKLNNISNVSSTLKLINNSSTNIGINPNSKCSLSSVTVNIPNPLNSNLNKSFDNIIEDQPIKKTIPNSYFLPLNGLKATDQKNLPPTSIVNQTITNKSNILPVRPIVSSNSRPVSLTPKASQMILPKTFKSRFPLSTKLQNKSLEENLLRKKCIDPSKRAVHNLMERKRREELKEVFSSLQSLLPIDDEKASKIMILREANTFLSELISKEKENASKLEKMRKENEELRNRISRIHSN